MVIGATEDIHLSSAFIEAFDDSEINDRNGAVRYMAHHMATAVIITTVTTSIGFASNVLSNLQIIQHFATVAAFGILANAVVTFLCVPPLLSHLGPSPSEGKAGKKLLGKQQSFNLLTPIADFCVKYLHDATNRHPKWVMTVTLTLILASGLILLDVSVNTDPMTFFPEDSEIIEHTDTVAEISYLIAGLSRLLTDKQICTRIRSLLSF